MNLFGPLGFGLGLIGPVIVLVLFAVVLPRFLFSRMAPTLVSVGFVFVLSSLFLVLLASMLFSALYIVQGAGVAGALSSAPVAAIIQFLKLGVSSALIWAPILLLVLFNLAQQTEA